MTETGRETIRLDKWLWHARFFKSRTLASQAVAEGRVRVNGERTDKPARAVGEGDVLTFALGATVRLVRIRAPGTRRGPAPEAQTLFEDLAAQAPDATSEGGPRPTKADRRALEKWRRTPLD